MQSLNDTALAKWERAKEAEEAGKYEDAIGLYKEGCEIMIEWLKFDKIPERAEAYKTKVEEIIEHTEKLKTMEKPIKADADSGAPNNSSEGKSSGKIDSELSGAIAQAIVKIKPDIKFSDVAGLDMAKQLLEEAVILPYRFPQMFQGKREPWRAILLYGVPGTGKTYIAKALAAECDMVFFSISSSDLVSKYMGESERLVAALFDMARKEDKAVIFIDEIDSLLSSRSSEENESSKRIKTEFMVQMQGVGTNNKGVLLLAATNFPENLDPAVRRRFEKKIEIVLPEWSARKQIIWNNIRDIDKTIEEADLDILQEETEGYSASDLATACKECIMMPIRELQFATYFRERSDNKFEMCGENDAGSIKKTLMEFKEGEQDRVLVPEVTLEHLRKSLKSCKKTVSQADIDRINKFTDEFGSSGN